MDAVTELAKLFRERENPSMQGICIGKVLAPMPALKIAVNGFILGKSNLVVAKHLVATYNSDIQSVGDHGQHSHSYGDFLKNGDRVIVIPNIDDSMYFVIDKVGDI